MTTLVGLAIAVVLVACVADWLLRSDDDVDRLLAAHRDRVRVLTGRDA